MLINYMEIMLGELLPSILKKYSQICQCPKCVKDIKAIALNNLKPMYVLEEKGYIYTKISQYKLQSQADIINELTKAIAIVHESPRHSLAQWGK